MRYHVDLELFVEGVEKSIASGVVGEYLGEVIIKLVKYQTRFMDNLGEDFRSDVTVNLLGKFNKIAKGTKTGFSLEGMDNLQVLKYCQNMAYFATMEEMKRTKNDKSIENRGIEVDAEALVHMPAGATIDEVMDIAENVRVNGRKLYEEELKGLMDML